MNYTENKTSREVGYQCWGELPENARKAFNDILHANGDEIDFFLAGYMYGKRAERTKKHKAQEPEQPAETLEDIPTLDTSKLPTLDLEKIPSLDISKLEQ